MRRALGIAAVVAALAAPGSAACSGGDDRPPPAASTGAAGTPLTGPEAEALAYPVFSDPEVPVYVGLGRRFGIAQPADPSSGERWELVAVGDRAVVVPLGTEFVGTPTGGAPPPAGGDGEPGPTQVLTFAAAGFGTTTIGIRRTRGAADAGADEPLLSFTVTVTLTGEPPPPEPVPTTAPAPGGADDGEG